VLGDDAVVVEPHQLDHVADVVFVLDPARRRPDRVGEDRMVDDPALGSQLGPHLLREAEVGGVVAVQVTELPAPDGEGELTSSSWTRFHTGPRGDLLDDLLAGCLRRCHGIQRMSGGVRAARRNWS
jgi:hypothetical protein